MMRLEKILRRRIEGAFRELIKPDLEDFVSSTSLMLKSDSVFTGDRKSELYLCVKRINGIL